MIKSNENEILTDQERSTRIANAAQHYGHFLTALGFDWQNDPNMQDTPTRVAKAFINELLQGCFMN